MVTQFNGPQEFVPWWDPRGSCARNCSFFSGEGATAFWTFTPAALTPPPMAATRPGLRGNDVVRDRDRSAADGVWRAFLHRRRDRGLVTILVIWFAYAWIYRWSSTRLTDHERIDAALTRLAWPGYRTIQGCRGREVGAESPRFERLHHAGRH